MAYQNIFIDNESLSKVVYVWDDKRGLIMHKWSDFNYAYTPDVNGKHISMTGKRVKKTRRGLYNNPDLFESDLPRETRVLTDLYLNEDTPSIGHTVLFFDIEVSMRDGIPRPATVRGKITSIAYYDTSSTQYGVMTLDEAGLHENKVIDGVPVSFYATERELLDAFMNKYEQISPTIISGWNSNGFDVPYLYNRTVNVCGHETANKLSPIGIVRYVDRNDSYKIAGVSSLDYFDLYKKYTYTELPNYRLDTVARHELDRGKVEYTGSLDALFETNLPKFIEYNLEDVRLLVDLNKKMKLIELVRGICHLAHIAYEDHGFSSVLLEGAIITYLHRNDIVSINRPDRSNSPRITLSEDDQEDEYSPFSKVDDSFRHHLSIQSSFVGAYVKDPAVGLHKWVYSLDLQSLYPSIIMTLNISPETKMGKVVNYDSHAHISGNMTEYKVVDTAGDYVSFTRDEFMNFIESNYLVVATNGVMYKSRESGLGTIPQILESWFAKRVEYKDLMKKYDVEGNKELAEYYDQMQHVQKIFLNSLYGVSGLPGWRYYDIDNAEAVTLTGQYIIKTSAKVLNSQYAKETGASVDNVIYCDTDSIYASSLPLLTGETDEKQFTIDTARRMEHTLNKFYDVMAKKAFNCQSHKFHIKGESVVKYGLWLAKKKYALDKVYDLEKNKDVDKIVVKGLDAVRSTFPKVFRDFTSQVLKDILRGATKSKIDTDVLTLKGSLGEMNYLNLARNTSVNGITKYTGPEDPDPNNPSKISFLKGAPVHVKAAMYYNNLLAFFKVTDRFAPIEDGEKIKYVYLLDNPYKINVLAIKGFEDPKEISEIVEKYIDSDALFEKELRNKIHDFYQALGWGLIPSEVNQNANAFFSL